MPTLYNALRPMQADNQCREEDQMRKLLVVAMFAMLLVAGRVASAEEWEKYDAPVPTNVVVRVLSHGAKAVSEHTGALVIIKDVRTGKELARGAVQGSTGDDIALMRAGYPRMNGRSGLMKGDKGFIFEDTKAAPGSRNPYFDVRTERKPEELKPVVYESTTDVASFQTTLNITKPTEISIEVYGPLLYQRQSAMAVGTTWVFPGEDITGEGIVLELRGLIVDTLASLVDSEIKLDQVKDGIPVSFYMRMMCGCPIAPAKLGLPWEAEGFNITVQAYYKGKLYHEEKTTSDKLFKDISLFLTKIPLPKDLPDGPFSKEKLKIRLMASQPSQNNFGMDEFSVYLTR